VIDSAVLADPDTPLDSLAGQDSEGTQQD
jgi:hypothetical protein